VSITNIGSTINLAFCPDQKRKVMLSVKVTFPHQRHYHGEQPTMLADEVLLSLSYDTVSTFSCLALLSHPS